MRLESPDADWNCDDRIPGLSRRRFLAGGAGVVGGLGLGLLGGVVAVPVARAAGPGADSFGPLLSPDANGLELPAGFSSRIVASTANFVGSTSHLWHTDPDGGATFATGDGGWIYVSNSERSTNGGVGAIRFEPDGAIADAYSILSGTTNNCSGGPTPWGTWLSCEETTTGQVYECDPFSAGSEGAARPALGIFRHEAAAVDPVHGHLYLTEDRSDGLLYRFTPDVWPSLDTGVLEAAEILGAGGVLPGEVRDLAWHSVPDPSAASVETRDQVPAGSHFNGGEGCWYEAGRVFFCTTLDNRVWKLETATQKISLLYDQATSATPFLSGGDNLTASSAGDVYVAEDGGNLEIVALTLCGDVKPVVRVSGSPTTEITGPALSPDGSRLYFSSQRDPGTTYEVTGPFVAPASVPSAGWLVRALVAGIVAASARTRLG
jgi:hypothetical protein